MNVEWREKIEWLNYWIEDADKDKSRIILLGDSVTRDLRKRLNLYMEGEYSVDLIAMSYSILDDMALEEIKHFFEKTTYKYESIIYMLGAHHGYYIECVKSSDAALKYECGIKEILNTLRMYSNNVIAIAPTFESESDKNGIYHNEEIGKRNQILNQVSEQLQIPFWDLNKEMDYSKIRYLDRCHFYEDCYEHIVELIIKKFFPETEYISANRIGTLEELYNKLNYYKDKRIYIYGNGIKGKHIKMYLKRKGYIFNGFIVSEQYADNLNDAVVINQIDVENTLIIVTPVDVHIWKELNKKGFDYISLNSEIYVSLELDNIEE